MPTENKTPEELYKITPQFIIFLLFFIPTSLALLSFIEYKAGRDWKEALITGIVVIICFIPVVVFGRHFAKKHYSELAQDKNMPKGSYARIWYIQFKTYAMVWRDIVDWVKRKKSGGK
jgi:hypothetical protein